MTQDNSETRYEEVYGDTFALYSKKEFLEFMTPFEIRFSRNNLSATNLFKGKKCFDAGCGNGRGTLFMLMNGAVNVTAYDYSAKNVDTTTKNLKEMGFNNFSCVQGTLENIPFPTSSFDFIWCNGVIMHTANPDKCLSEISRILRVNGGMWLYLYGAGGVYWRVVNHLRELMRPFPINRVISILKLMRYETRYIAEFIDDWYASHLRAYTNSDLAGRLETLGFSSPTPLKYGADYDTSHRVNIIKSSVERALMGEGDLRYLQTKSQGPRADYTPLSAGDHGSNYEWPTVIVNEIDPIFNRVKQICRADIWKAVAVAAKIQRELRLLLTEEREFPMQELKAMCESTVAIALEECSVT
jgi:ubiquinone/menaquinone biosynthesis C-methylase UbiE